MEKTGILALTKLSKQESEMFMEYLYNSKQVEYLDFIKIILKDDFLKFIDLFSGETIKVPSREEALKIISYIKIYVYCKERGFSEQAYQSATRVFSRRKNSVKRIVEKVDKVLNKINEIEPKEIDGNGEC